MLSLKALIILIIIRRRRQRRLRQLEEQQKKRKKQRRWWVHPINMKGKEKGAFYSLRPDLLADTDKFFNHFRMNSASFEKLLGIVGPRITRISQREPISAAERLMVTLRFLASGDSYHSLSYNFRIALSTVSGIVKETCTVIGEELAKYIKIPQNEAEWLQVADGFQRKWQFPHCLGSIDGKHIRLKKPVKSGSLYFNYKDFFSIVLLAVCDANYRILYAHMGSYGSDGDAGIFGRSDLADGIKRETLNLPGPAPLPGTDVNTSYYFIGDGAFPLSTRLMKPFGGVHLSMQQRTFNYRARRTIENCFGIMSAEWRILLKAIETTDTTLSKKSAPAPGAAEVEAIYEACTVDHSDGTKWSGEDDLDEKLGFSDDDSNLDVGLSACSSNSKTPRRNTNKCKWDDSLEKPVTSVVDSVDVALLSTLQSTLEAKQHQAEVDEPGLYMQSLAAFMRRLPPKKQAQFRFKLEEVKLQFSEEE